MVGHTVNLAARLMQAAVDDVLCDATTLRLASSRLRFETLAPVKMKGITQPGAGVPPRAGRREHPGPRAAARGWWAARRSARGWPRAVRALAERGVGGTLLLEGEAGMGKSVLVGELLEKARAAGLSTALGLGTALEGSPVWHAWRAVLSRLLGLEGLPDEAARTARLLERLSAWPEQEAWAPLLNGVLPVAVPENEGVRNLTAALRITTTRELLVQLLDDCSRERPRLVVLDDAHWMDSASWELALAVQRRVKRLLLVLSSRPAGEAVPAEYRQLRDSPGTVHLPVGRMSYEDVLTLVRQRLGVRTLPAQVATFIRDRAEGHPLFSEELACALREAGYLVIERGECRLAARSVEKMALELPGTIQGLITSRIDRLTQQQQLTLKVASVLGRAFPFELLRAVHPVEADRPTLPQQLAELERLDLVQREESGSGPVYAFKHVLIQEAAYHLMAFSQRRELHRAVALLHEREQEERGEQLQPLLAHHWRLAEQPERALEHLERAARGRRLARGPRGDGGPAQAGPGAGHERHRAGGRAAQGPVARPARRRVPRAGRDGAQPAPLRQRPAPAGTAAARLARGLGRPARLGGGAARGAPAAGALAAGAALARRAGAGAAHPGRGHLQHPRPADLLRGPAAGALHRQLRRREPRRGGARLLHRQPGLRLAGVHGGPGADERAGAPLLPPRQRPEEPAIPTSSRAPGT